MLGGGDADDTPAEVLSDGRVLFNGKDYGKDFHVKPTKVTNVGNNNKNKTFTK